MTDKVHITSNHPTLKTIPNFDLSNTHNIPNTQTSLH